MGDRRALPQDTVRGHIVNKLLWVWERNLHRAKSCWDSDLKLLVLGTMGNKCLLFLSVYGILLEPSNILSEWSEVIAESVGGFSLFISLFWNFSSTKLHFNLNFYILGHMLCHHMCMFIGGCDLWELALSFHHMEPEDQTGVIRLGNKCFYPRSHLSSPILILINVIAH